MEGEFYKGLADGFIKKTMKDTIIYGWFREGKQHGYSRVVTNGEKMEPCFWNKGKKISKDNNLSKMFKRLSL